MKHVRRGEVARQIGMLPALLGPPPNPGHPGGRLAHQPGQLTDQPHMVTPRGLQQGGPGPRHIGLLEHPHDLGRLLGLHRLRHLVGRRHTVGQHVMDLVDDRDAVVGQALGDVHLPQRATAVQRGAGNLADQLIQLAAPTRSGHPRLPNVIVEVDVVVDHPHRVMQLQRNVDQLVTQRRHGLQPRERHGAKQVEAESPLDVGHIQHTDLERVHVDFRRLGIQHQGVHAVESLHTHPILQRLGLVPAIALLRWPRQATSEKVSARGVTLRRHL